MSKVHEYFVHKVILKEPQITRWTESNTFCNSAFNCNTNCRVMFWWKFLEVLNNKAGILDKLIISDEAHFRLSPQLKRNVRIPTSWPKSNDVVWSEQLWCGRAILFFLKKTVVQSIHFGTLAIKRLWAWDFKEWAKMKYPQPTWLVDALLFYSIYFWLAWFQV